MRSVASTRGRPEHGERQDFEPVDAVRRDVPGRPAADQRERLREVVAAGAHGGRAPEVEHDPLRPVAVVLGVAGEHLFGRAPADLPGVAGRDGTRIDGVEVAAGRQDVEPTARRRARRPRRQEAPGERGQKAERLGRAAGRDPLGERLGGLRVERDAGGEAVGAFRRAAEHMQAVADPHVLEVAEPGVERGERFLRRLRLGGAFRDEAGGAPAFQDQRGDGAGAARIEPLRLGIFVVEAFELERRPVRAGGDQRRRQMADRRRADAPLGLRRLAGIVDDERIDDRRRADENFGRAAFGQRDRLARQPFERAVRAELDQRVDPFLARSARHETRRIRGEAEGSGRDSRPCGSPDRPGRAEPRRPAGRAGRSGSGTRHRRRPDRRPDRPRRPRSPRENRGASRRAPPRSPQSSGRARAAPRRARRSAKRRRSPRRRSRRRLRFRRWRRRSPAYRGRRRSRSGRRAPGSPATRRRGASPPRASASSAAQRAASFATKATRSASGR